MPRGDGTGPAGFGPLTGRGAGYCAGYPVPGRNPYREAEEGLLKGGKEIGQRLGQRIW